MEMLVIRQLVYGDRRPLELESRALCGETVNVRINRSSMELFSLNYLPASHTFWQEFRLSGAGALALEGKLAGAVIWGAFQDEKFVGSMIAAPTALGWLDLVDIRTDAQHRRQGVGTMLLETAVRMARTQRNLTAVRAVTGDDNPAMCRFCEHAGFRLQGMDRSMMALTPEQRMMPLMKRTCALFFYLPIEGN